MMKKILGGKERACRYCSGTVVYLKVRYLGVVTQCKNCGSLTNGRVKDEIKIYSYSEVT